MEEMSSVERVETALRLEEPDRVPVWFLAFSIGAREIGASMYDYSTDGRVMAEAVIAFLKKYDVDIATVGNAIALRAEAFGTKTKYYDDPTVEPVIGETVVKDQDDWGRLEFNRNAPGIKAYIEALKILSDELGGKTPIMAILNDPTIISTWLAGLKEVMVAIKKQPEALKNGLNHITELWMEYVGSILEVMKPDLFIVPSSRASQDILSMEQYKEFCEPYTKRVYEFLRKKNIPAIGNNSGNIPYLHQMVENWDFAALNWWDRGSPYGLREIKEKYGKKIALMCGLDQTKELMYGTIEDVERQAKDAIKQGAKDGGFFLATGGSVLSPLTPSENIHVAVETAKKFGRYPIDVG